MKYITGIHALNLECSLNTCGDWHQSSIDWKNIWFAESNGSIFGDWGIEKNTLNSIVYRGVPHANHLRAIIDLMYLKNYRNYLKGFREDFICTDEYNDEFFEKVYMLHELKEWDEIAALMKREYMQLWDEFLLNVTNNSKLK